MSEEEVNALVAQKEQEVKAEYETKMNELSTKANNLVEEVKTERAKKQEAEAERDLLKTKITPPKQEGSVEEAVQAILNAEKQKEAQKAREKAEKKFKEENPEFHPDNDPGGIKFSALQEKLKRWNLNTVESEEDFLAIFDEANTLLNKGKQRDEKEDFNPYAHTSSNNSSSAAQPPKDKPVFSEKEKRLIAHLGWTPEKYVAMKAKRPTYVKELVSHMQD